MRPREYFTWAILSKSEQFRNAYLNLTKEDDVHLQFRLSTERRRYWTRQLDDVSSIISDAENIDSKKTRSLRLLAPGLSGSPFIGGGCRSVMPAEDVIAEQLGGWLGVLGVKVDIVGGLIDLELDSVCRLRSIWSKRYLTLAIGGSGKGIQRSMTVSQIVWPDAILEETSSVAFDSFLRAITCE